MRYSEKLRDPRWQKKRLEILQRDNWTCQECGCTDKTLAVHHLIYEHGCAPWDYYPFYLRTLCEDCHAAYHENKDAEARLLMENLFITGMTLRQLNELSGLVSDIAPMRKESWQRIINDLEKEIHSWERIPREAA